MKTVREWLGTLPEDLADEAMMVADMDVLDAREPTLHEAIEVAILENTKLPVEIRNSWRGAAANAMDGMYGDVPKRKPGDPQSGQDPKAVAAKVKTPLFLVPPALMKATAEALATGAEKYGRGNWRMGHPVKATTYIGACMRHMDAWRDGEDFDPESGLCHLAHAAATLAILLDVMACGLLDDDRIKLPKHSCQSPT